MGEIAEMMLDGTLCAGCGVYLHGQPQGIPRYCHSCVQAIRARAKPKAKQPSPFVRCCQCGKRVKEAGLADHMKAKHTSFVVRGKVTLNLDTGIATYEDISNDSQNTL